jgi:type IV secretory pathway VirB10-like protein
MSTILKALKKLEQEKEPLGARILSHTVATAAAAKRRPAGLFASSKPLLRVAVIGAAFIGIVGVALYYYNRSRTPVTPEPRASESVRKPAPQQPEPPPQWERPPDPPPRNVTADAVAQAKPALPKRIESRERSEQGQNLPNTTPPDATAASRAEVDSTDPQTGPVRPATPTGSVPPAEPDSDTESAYANAGRLMDNRLKIQAIAWSSVPDERMAVINSRIVREGGSVEGFSVVAIRSDDVIVREKGQLYRVVFGSP